MFNPGGNPDCCFSHEQAEMVFKFAKQRYKCLQNESVNVCNFYVFQNWFTSDGVAQN